MKYFIIITSIVFVFASCDIYRMENEGTVAPENEGLEYLTITYHSKGHTSGEPPVDPTRFPVPRMDPGPPMSFIVQPGIAFLLDQGTLEKEGYVFHSWIPRQDISPTDHWCDHENTFLFAYFITQNIDFDAYWVRRLP